MSKNNSEYLQPQKNSKLVPEVRSANDLCVYLNKLIQQPEWKIETQKQFIHLIINPEKQFQLDVQQQDSLFKAIINCPLKYRAIVHLTIVAANFNSADGLRTLDKIITKIGHFVSESLNLQESIQENILKSLGNKQVAQFIKEKINTKDPNQKLSKEKEDEKKFDFLRNLISLLICEGELSAIANCLSIILEVLAGSNYYQQFTKTQLELEDDIKSRVKSVVELFKLTNPNAAEAKRLLLYGLHSQIRVSQQEQKITDLRNNLQFERNSRKQREDYTSQLEQQCQELKKLLGDVEKKLEQRQIDLEQERELYAQLTTFSQTKISQQREAALSNIRNRLSHELNKLERLLSNVPESFQENSQIGSKIIKKIREQLTE